MLTKSLIEKESKASRRGEFASSKENYHWKAKTYQKGTERENIEQEYLLFLTRSKYSRSG